mgnify:CR=1 FL=1
MTWRTRNRRSLRLAGWLLGAALLTWSWFAVYYRSYMDRVHGGIAAYRVGGSDEVREFFLQYESESHVLHYARGIVEEIPRARHVFDPILIESAWTDRWARPMNLGFLGAAVADLILPVAWAIGGRRPG